ncbi:hypothetical protein OpiT1DRAFT_00175 [Opitutaceae bacterium TAV1]|nr:hypothetical protein OpiT1DRAFT_00175 [Opitutaceae bacterium TAV1]
MKTLSYDQLNGTHCVVCGEMWGVGIALGLETSVSTEVFRCDRVECVVEPAEVQRWIDASDKPARRRGRR